jgi:hypothetical protein
MNNTLAYQQLIYDGIKGLSSEALVEVVNFIYFVRKRTFQPAIFEEELRTALLDTELRGLSREEEFHLEKEFEDYDKLYPRE